MNARAAWFDTLNQRQSGEAKGSGTDEKRGAAVEADLRQQRTFQERAGVVPG